jgi:1-deoxy-D-xylulose-5-phosphate reductoisomerase
MTQQTVTILGATGSIGQSTIDVVLRHPERFRIHALTANRRMDALAADAKRTQAACVVVPDSAAAQAFKVAFGAGVLPEIRVGARALVQTAGEGSSDVVMAAIVGIAGLPAALAAAQAGKRVLLANKEALVAAGSLFMAAVTKNAAQLLPIDSEHNAIFQCMPHGNQTDLPGRRAPGVEKIVLTASGGPFRSLPLQDIASVTPEQACAHPNWEMGQKISVDSATMLNKGLEVIEAHWLFDMPAHHIDVVIHPQSVIHSMVQYHDGSVLAQLGNPDMRTPIAHALGFPERIQAGVDMLDLVKVGQLSFEPVDLVRYPCLNLAYEALRAGQAACISLNAANEVAVALFLQRRLPYLEIAQLVHRTLDWQAGQATTRIESLEDVLAIDQRARTFAQQSSQTRLPLTRVVA